MKGLEKIPDQTDFINCYNSLQSNPLNEDQLLKYFQWVRFDPRLGEILVAKLLTEWRSLNPLSIYLGLQQKPWATVMGVLLDMVQLKISTKESKHFSAWKNCILHKIKKNRFQQFFIGLTAFAGKQVHQQLDKSNKIYKKWNFYGSHLFFNKEKMVHFKRSALSLSQRMKILDRFLSTQQSPISVNDYLKLLQMPVSRRVAELDLKHHPKLKAKGFTKSRVYVVTT